MRALSLKPNHVMVDGVKGCRTIYRGGTDKKLVDERWQKKIIVGYKEVRIVNGVLRVTHFVFLTVLPGGPIGLKFTLGFEKKLEI